MKNGKTCFGVIIGTRAYFNSELAKDVRKQLLKTLDEGGYEYIILPEDATPTGSSSIETREDGLKVSKQFRAHRDEIDGIIVSLPNFGFEIGIINAISDADLNVPVMVQACDDENDKVDLDSRRDAFCGKISVCNNLYQYGIPFTDTTLHTYSIYDPLLKKDIDRFAAICRVVNGLRHCRLGQIGTRPLGFNTCRASEKLLQRSGITVVPADLSPESLEALRWQPAKIAHVEGIEATPQMCQLNAVKETLTAVSITSLGDDRWLVDMGKAFNGLFEIHLPALPAGTEVKAEYSDGLEAEGKIKDLRSSDLFIASGRQEGDVFRNRFNHHCFRYVLLSNLPQQPLEARAYRIGMDVEPTGTFESSDSALNAIHEMIRYTMDCLMFSGYMVDCAHIERLGYGGDGNASTLSLQNMFDVAPLYLNWLQAWNDAIQPDGGLPHTAPCPYKAGGGPYWCSFIVQAPWRTWMNFGDDRPLRRSYANMKLWLQYVDAYTQDGLLRRWPDLEYRNWYLGDWLAPEGVDVMAQESVDLVDNCALSQSYAELIEIARYLGEDADRQDFERRREALNQRIHETFYHPESHTYGTGSQLDMAYPLLTDVAPADIRDSVQTALLGGRDHLGVGLVGVPVLAEWLTRSHAVDFMYTMLRQEDYPGYLYMLRHGATATWENWRNPRSSIHNCFNGIDSWFVQALGGIIPTEPGYKTMLIDPQVPQGLQWVTVTRETPYGQVLVHWEQTPQGTKAHIQVPPGTTAILQGKPVGSGSYDIML